MSKNKEYVISNIIFNKKDIVLKYIDEGEEKEISLFPSVYSEFYLYVGKTLLSDELKEIKVANKSAKYFDIAYKLVSRKEYSSLLLKRKLKEKGVPEEYLYKIIKTLKEQHLLDDERYALDYKDALDIKLYGKNYIIKALKEAGIKDEFIFTIEFVNEEEKINKLMPQLIKKRSKESYLLMKQHLYQDLSLRGYESELINQVLETLQKDDEEKEEEKCLLDYQKYYRIYKGKYDKKELTSRIITSLMRKGHSYGIIKKVMEENEDEWN